MRKVFTLGFLLLALGSLARAQFPVELACPAGTGVAYSGQARDNITQGLKQHFCLDNAGNLTIQPQQIIQGTTGVAVAPLSVGLVTSNGNGESLTGTFTSLSGQSGPAGQNSQNNPPTTANPFFAEIHSFVAASGLAAGIQCCFSGNGSLFWLYYMTSFSAKLFISNPAAPPIVNSRYFVGLMTWNNGSALGNNGSQPFSTAGAAGLENHVPNRTLVGFRLDQITIPNDNTWHAIAVQPGASPTFQTIDCGVPADNNAHTFQIILTPDNVSFLFSIDGNSCGSLPASGLIKVIPSTVGGNSNDNLVSIFWSADNNNVANQAGMGMLYMTMGLKLQ